MENKDPKEEVLTGLAEIVDDEKKIRSLNKSLNKDKKIKIKEDKKKADNEKWNKVLPYMQEYKELCDDVIDQLDKALKAKANLNRARSCGSDLITENRKKVGEELKELENKEEKLRVMKRDLKKDKLDLGLEKIFKRALKIKTN